VPLTVLAFIRPTLQGDHPGHNAAHALLGRSGVRRVGVDGRWDGSAVVWLACPACGV